VDSPRAVLLLSGGLDSYTAGALMRERGFELYALTVLYGQRHAHEVAAARAVASRLDVARHVELAVDLRRFGGSSLTSDDPVPLDRAIIPDEIPSTYVPARNTVMLSLALAWAETVDAADIVIGVNALDYSGYPDCRPEYVAAFEAMARLATRAGVSGRPLTIHAPLQHWTKARIIVEGLRLGLDYGLTHSCYSPAPGGGPCGRCDSCVLRAVGFAQAGAPDPLMNREAPPVC